jgi:hypothetical protein
LVDADEETVILTTFQACHPSTYVSNSNPVSKCAYCGAPTVLHMNGVPVCIECDEKRTREVENPKKPAQSEPTNEPRQKSG